MYQQLILPIILVILLSYMIGSISGGIIIGKLKNIDIRKEGSNNAGATNALRTMGTAFAVIVLIIDVYKGYFATHYIPYLVFEFYPQEYLQQSNDLYKNLINELKVFAAISSIMGHVYPLYFKFKGGKGVGTALGTLFAFSEFYYSILVGFIFWTSSLILTGFVGLSSIISGISVSLIYLTDNGFMLNTLAFYSIIIALFFIFTHRENILRMISGKENQFKKVMLINLFKKNNE